MTFAKQAKPLRYFESIEFNLLAGRRGRRHRNGKGDRQRLPLRRSTANAYDAFNWDAGPPAHKEYIGG